MSGTTPHPDAQDRSTTLTPLHPHTGSPSSAPASLLQGASTALRPRVSESPGSPSETLLGIQMLRVFPPDSWLPQSQAGLTNLMQVVCQGSRGHLAPGTPSILCVSHMNLWVGPAHPPLPQEPSHPSLSSQPRPHCYPSDPATGALDPVTHGPQVTNETHSSARLPTVPSHSFCP